ncbi:accessory gene regulator ArgB-like protein [Clostridium estertheticum]|uniref:accessory gene regulator ArgB-like protein n=1 Tax=Clostridium estertheticum TaxID=238834 RepID=UPI001C6F4025|nr:accessory gene regulator B family protein [Clostridium estertheticum]MBW9154626.1 accessory gene regulator B family protein [Clostridium estertheticum]WLC86536.1 accessory gene regulator B family protein [Clostridium estertheticum]
MGINEKLNALLMEFIKKNLNKTEEEIEILHYGTQVILMNVYKLIILFVTAYFINVFTYTLIAFIIFGIIRSVANGVHADSSIKCIFINYIVFLGNVFFSLLLGLNRISIIIIFLISFILVLKYAPADTAERPLVSKNLRKALKLKAILIVLISCILSLLLSSSIYKSIITYAILEESFLITPLAYFIFKKPYKNYETLNLSKSYPYTDVENRVTYYRNP